jgi:hypothetical protein
MGEISCSSPEKHEKCRAEAAFRVMECISARDGFVPAIVVGAHTIERLRGLA